MTSEKQNEKQKMKLITVWIPITDLKIIDQFVKCRLYTNRSEFIRMAIKRLIQETIEEVENVRAGSGHVKIPSAEFNALLQLTYYTDHCDTFFDKMYGKIVLQIYANEFISRILSNRRMYVVYCTKCNKVITLLFNSPAKGYVCPRCGEPCAVEQISFLPSTVKFLIEKIEWTIDKICEILQNFENVSKEEIYDVLRDIKEELTRARKYVVSNGRVKK